MDHFNVPAKFESRSFTLSWDNSGYLKTVGSPWIRRSRSSKLVDFGTNLKRVCDFLLVCHTVIVTLVQRYHCFGDIAGFLGSWVTPPLFHPNFGGVPIAPDHPCWGQPEQKPHAIRPKNYFWSIPTCVKIIPQHLRWTDGQTTYCGITALCVA